MLAWLGAAAVGPGAVVQAAGAAALAPAAAGAQPAGAGRVAPAELLRAGGVALMLRHATTDPGIGDPPGFRAGECATQRNLSDEGRDEARRIGAWFARQRLVPAAVRSSAWCRCLDTARLAFGTVAPWPALDSFFGQRTAGDERARLQALDAALRGIAPGRFEVWVTHQVNVSAATGEPVGMGEGVVVRAGAAAATRLPVLARLDFRA